MPPSILFLDAHDSFSNNITSQLATLLGVTVSVVPIDAPLSPAQFAAEVRRHDAVVCGPGPGAPGTPADVGLMPLAFAQGESGGEHGDRPVVPVLGVCLGFQVLARTFGARVGRLGRGLHGMVHEVEHAGGDIFAGVGSFRATLYHSLHADVGQGAVAVAAADADDDGWASAKWTPLAGAPALTPLAWAASDADPRILMAVRHARLPFWGVQYHPESVCTEEVGGGVLRNWFAAAQAWNAARRAVAPGPADPAVAAYVARARKESRLGRIEASAGGLSKPNSAVDAYVSSVVALPEHVSPPDVVEMLGLAGAREHIIFDSSSARRGVSDGDGTHDTKGRFSIIAADVGTAVRVTHRAGTHSVVIKNPDGDGTTKLTEGDDVWGVVSRFWAARRWPAIAPPNLPSDVPFRGGFMGYVTYEMGLAGIDVDCGRTQKGSSRPDLCLVWVTRSLVLDHVEGRLTVQSLGGREGEREWVEGIVSTLQASPRWADAPPSTTDTPAPKTDDLRAVEIRTPEEAHYKALVEQCQEYIAAGESYELCLTGETSIVLATDTTSSYAMDAHPPPTRASTPASLHSASTAESALTAPTTATTASLASTTAAAATSTAPSPWSIYKTLRHRQPAPFSSFLRLRAGPTLISASPERFLSYTPVGRCRMHPMKGTVRKTRPDGTVVTRAEAEAVLQTPKERAENLMIVDLVRHDLHGVCGAGRVGVPVLMRVEEYATVFQMVTVVEGDLFSPGAASGEGSSESYTGIDVLAAALPPGSMTGAPKKRSCELLNVLEAGRERSMYSGAVGYMDVTGRGDWSVTIRSLFRWEDEDQDTEGANAEVVWKVGAGGAVTGLSSPQGEFDEMMTKLGGPLGVFGWAP